MEVNSPETGVQKKKSHSHHSAQDRAGALRRYLTLLSPSSYYIFQALLIALILGSQFRLLKRDLDIPIDFRGDTVYTMAIIKAIAREGWWWHVDSISAPEGLNLVAMPILGNLDAIIIRLLALFTQEAGLLTNLYWFGTIVAAGVISTWCIRRLGVDHRVAFVLGILYAFTPHIYYRHAAHLMLTHHLIPLIGTLAVLLAAGRSEDVRGTTRFGLLSGCVLIGFSYVYYAFFSSFVMLVGGLVGFLRRRDYGVARLAGIAVGIVILSATLNLLPSIRSWIVEPGGRTMISFKSAAEADYYGLKIRHLLTPTLKSPIPLLVALRGKIEAAQFPLDQNNESTLSRMGVVPSVGFLLLIAVSVFVTLSSPTTTLEILKAAGALTIACLLLATVGGFGSMFNLLVRPDIRAYNRIAIFIVFFSLLAVAVVLSKAIAFVPRNRWTRAAIAISLAILLTVGLVDQDESYILNASRGKDEAKFHILSDFVRKIEKEMPPGATVYQLPHMPYGDGDTSAPLNPRTEPSDPQEPFLLSNSVRWSWPAVSTEAISFARRVGQLDAPALVQTLRDRGFLGIHIDRLAYADAADLIKDLGAYLDRSPLNSADQRYAFFNLGTNSDRSDLHQYTWGEFILFAPNGGNAAVHLGEGWSCVGCTEGNYSTMNFSVTPADGDITIKAHLTPALFGGIQDRPVRVLVDDVAVGEWDVREPNWYLLSVPHRVVEKKTRFTVRFEFPNAVSPKSLGLNQDTRVLSVAFDSLMLLAKGEKSISIR